MRGVQLYKPSSLITFGGHVSYPKMIGMNPNKNTNGVFMNDWSQFPKLYSLFKDSETESEFNYFSVILQRRVLSTSLAQESYLQLEDELSVLSEAAWIQFRQKILPYISKKDPLRHYEQLFNHFNEVKGYVFLSSLGYKRIEFIEEHNSFRTPDLIAKDLNNTALMEVKTINNSNKGLVRIRERAAGNVLGFVPDPLFRKIEKTVRNASEQLLSYSNDGTPINRRIIYLCLKPVVDVLLDNRNIDTLRNFCQNVSDENIEVVSDISFF